MSIGILLYLDLEFWEGTLKTLTPSLQENAKYFTTRSYLTLTIQRAARFFCLIKESFGADCKSFSMKARDIHKAVDYLKEVSKRLNRVLIENQDFERLIKTYDRLDALFYLDPPYYEAEKYYPDRFNPEDHNRLRKCLEDIKGKFILSYNDCPQIRELYEGYVILTVERNHNLSLGNQYKEILIKNYK